MQFIVYLLMVGVYLTRVQSKHRIVNEAEHYALNDEGWIIPVEGSRYQLKVTNDVINLLEQDTRWNRIVEIYQQLVTKQRALKKMWKLIRTELNIAEYLGSDAHCQEAVPLYEIDWYTTQLSMSQGVAWDEYKLDKMSYEGKLRIPDCKKLSSLSFSMVTYDHLPGMQAREHLISHVEPVIAQQVNRFFKMDMEKYGHWLATALKQNTSSWLHYNLAAMYWRYKGNPSMAMECIRRSVLYAPRDFKDIPLLTMGTILHNSGFSTDALVILEASIEHNLGLCLNHYVMGHAYAVHGQFQQAVKHYNMSLRIKPDFEHPVLYRHAVLCIEKLLDHLNAALSLIEKFSNEVSAYCELEEVWFRTQDAFLKVLSTTSHVVSDYRSFEDNVKKMSRLLKIDINPIKITGEKLNFIKHLLEHTKYEGSANGVHGLKAIYHWKNVVDHIHKLEGRASEFVIRSDELKNNYTQIPIIIINVNQMTQEIEKFMHPHEKMRESHKKKKELEEKKKRSREKKKEARDKKEQSSQPKNDLVEFAVGEHLYISPTNVDRQSKYFDIDDNWPTNSFCKQIASQLPEDMEAIYPVFLPFENKGLRLNKLLTDKIGVPATIEHKLPWHPPQCPQDKDADKYTQKKYQRPQVGNEVIKAVSQLKEKLLEYVGDGEVETVKNMQEAEIGQRIHSAVQMNLAPKWILYTLTSLYWRVRRNNAYALNCLIGAERLIQDLNYRDLVLVSLSSVFLEMGFFEEAKSAVDEAFKINIFEPATHFILAEVNMINKNSVAHMSHLKTVGRVEPDFMGGVSKMLVDGWACIYRQADVLQKIDMNILDEVGICTKMEPTLYVRCNSEGYNCDVSDKPCPHNSGTSALVRMMKENVLEHEFLMEENRFDAVITNMPSDTTDMAGHIQNFQLFRKILEKSLILCVEHDCLNNHWESKTLSRPNCDLDQDLGFWLQLAVFAYLMSSEFSKITKDIPILTPEVIKEPECHLDWDPSEDYFLERLITVDTHNWKENENLMHYNSGLYEVTNYAVLGAKIAEYVETRPQSWMGALGAGWWCGAKGRAKCAVRCFAASFANAPKEDASHAIRSLVTLLQMQQKPKDAKEIALLSWYYSPRYGVDAYIAGIAHADNKQYNQALWMYRYALTLDKDIPSVMDCVHFTRCLRDFGGKDQITNVK